MRNALWSCHNVTFGICKHEQNVIFILWNCPELLANVSPGKVYYGEHPKQLKICHIHHDDVKLVICVKKIKKNLHIELFRFI